MSKRWVFWGGALLVPLAAGVSASGAMIEQPGLVVVGAVAMVVALAGVVASSVNRGTVVIDDELGLARSRHGQVQLSEVTEVSVDRVLGPATPMFRTKLCTEQTFLAVFGSRWPEETRAVARELAEAFSLPVGDLLVPHEPAQAAVRPSRVLVDGDRLIVPSRNLLHSLGTWTLHGHGSEAALEHKTWFGLRTRVWSASELGPIYPTPAAFVRNTIGLRGQSGHVLVSTRTGGLWVGQGLTDGEIAWVARELRARLAGLDAHE